MGDKPRRAYAVGTLVIHVRPEDAGGPQFATVREHIGPSTAGQARYIVECEDGTLHEVDESSISLCDLSRLGRDLLRRRYGRPGPLDELEPKARERLINALGKPVKSR